MYFKHVPSSCYDVFGDYRINAAKLDFTIHMISNIAYDTPTILILYFKLIYIPFYNVICVFRINAAELDITLDMMGSIAYKTP